jgi:hypothetical protein
LNTLYEDRLHLYKTTPPSPDPYRIISLHA